MKYLFLILVGFMFTHPVFAKESKTNFDTLFPVLTAPVQGEEISPKTTKELESLFISSEGTLPRVFIKHLPADFKDKGNKELFSKVVGALILRENEQILSERVLFNLLKQKYNKGEKWTQKEQAYFNYLVEKYDAIVLKTILTKINDLEYKIDEIPLSMAISQAALQTNWGKENLASIYAQKGWKDKDHYDFVEYPDMIAATSAYVKEMNGTPNYDEWRRVRTRREQKDSPRYALNFASGLDVYMPEDVFYPQKIKDLLKANTFLFNYDQMKFND